MWYEEKVAKEILKRKYLHDGETFNGFVKRVSSIFEVSIRDKMRKAIRNGDFFPAGRILYGAGLEKQGKHATPFNCYVLPSPKDSIEEIYDVNKKAARVASYGGGYGTTIDYLRPKNAKVNNSAKTSTGAVSFLELFNTTGNVIGQEGRRSATMIGLICTHPDLEEFLKIKETNHKLESMNISIKFTDDFFKAVEQNKMWKLHFEVPETGEVIEREINAREFFKRFCKVNADYGDPGAIFIDTVNNNHLLSGYDEYKIEISNPCSEFMGAAYTACCLGSINLYNCVEHKFSDKAFFNFDKLKYLVEIGVIALNNVLDYGYDKQPLPENKKAIKDWRNIGLGFFGLADALVALGIKYGSYEAQSLAYDITNTMMTQALDTSCDLAYDDGPFDKFDWEKTKNNPIMGKLSCTNKKLYNDIKEFGLRNGSLISIAPTGSISLLVGETGGIEPFFKVSYERTTHKLEADAEKSNTEKQTFKVFPISIRELLAYHNLPETLSNEEIKKRFPFIVEASEIPYTERIAMQQACQANIDNAISSTINLPSTATAKDIEKIFILAWKSKLKGITVFKDDCKRLSILNPKKVSKNSEQEQKQDAKPMGDFGKLLPKKRGNIVSLPAITYKGQSACARLYSTITGLNGHPFEVFINPTGGCNANINTIGRLTSLLLRSGVAPEVVIEELSSQKCPACQQLRKQGRTDVALSCGNAIANALKDFNKNKAVNVEAKVVEEPVPETNTQSETEREKMKCPKCGAELRNTGKCVSCDVCGWNTCGD